MATEQAPGVWTLVQWLLGGLVGLLQLIFGYQVLRIGKLEEGKADKSTINEIKTMIGDLDGKLDDTIANWNKVDVRVGRLEGRAEKEDTTGPRSPSGQRWG